MSESDVQHLLDESMREVAHLRAENERLRTLLTLSQRTQAVVAANGTAKKQTADLRATPVDSASDASKKVALMRSLFRGRDDVYACRWENSHTGKSGYAPAVEGGWTRAPKAPKTYLPLTDEAIADHLRGKTAIGIYSLLEDDTCWFLACDLDGSTWKLDALALYDVCAAAGVPAALEQSRSGNGAHLWVFFTRPVAAASARRLGAFMLREAMTRRAELDLASYDRLFPNQDVLPQRGLGNLIALPLQGRSRAAGTSLFVDPANLEPWPDQWAFLSSIERLEPESLGRLEADSDEFAVGEAAVSRKSKERYESLPAEIPCQIGADLAIPKTALPPPLLAELKHLASLHNPLFYERQRLRLSTHKTPRLIRCYEEDQSHLHLPRGLLAQLDETVEAAGSRLAIAELRRAHEPLPLEFRGELTPLQERAVVAMLAHDDGVLVAPPGTGKTVIACALIAERKLPALIVAHSKPLLEQWRAQLQALLGLPNKQIGQFGGGRRKRTGIVDLAMIQSLKAIDDLDEFFGDYGLVVVDECHHVPAFSFEACVRRAPVRHFLGLTATPYRRDGLQEIVTMQCGPVRHRIATSDGPAGEISLALQVRPTEFAPAQAGEIPIQELFRQLVEDDARTSFVCGDVIAAAGEGRRCLVLSQWKQHCEALAKGLRERGASPLVLEGGLGKRARTALVEQIEQTPPDEPLVVVATGQYLGEGFDCPKLDALFLAFPVSFKGRLVQYTGRLMRAQSGKTSVRVYDYADVRVPVLRAMHRRRLTTYKTLGFSQEQSPPVASSQLAVPILGS